MDSYDVYLYGMILVSNSFLLENGFVKPDEYSEIKAKYRFPGGETGTSATVLSSLSVQVKMDGTHVGYNTTPIVKNFYKDKSVNLDSLYFDEKKEGLEDYVLISDDVRTPLGSFGHFYSEAFSTGIKPWNHPKEDDIIHCKIAALDAFFQEDSDTAAKYCIKHNKPYVTIDCPYDSFIHQHSAISIISGEFIHSCYPGKTREDLFESYQNNGSGLTIITNGGKPFFYARKGEKKKTFSPYQVNVVSTLGAGDTFKAACTYGLLHHMSDDDLVRFASACSAVAISRYPMQLNPPTLPEIEALIKNHS